MCSVCKPISIYMTLCASKKEDFDGCSLTIANCMTLCACQQYGVCACMCVTFALFIPHNEFECSPLCI